jgi:predicted GNAT family acetyltransferase
MKQALTRASQELFRRTPDESFATLDELWANCQTQQERSRDLWEMPDDLEAFADGGRLALRLGEDRSFRLNSWSFSQLCGLAGVSRDTVNRLTGSTASSVCAETLPRGTKPLQVFAADDLVRSIHGASYTRLHDLELLSIVREFATDFQPPQQAGGGETKGGTGLYRGEQDMFCFLIDPTGWTEINGEAFAPGFFLWNSEVGKRSVGIQTFWFQAVCRNHIVWDAVEVIDFSRKHTANVRDALREIRVLINRLVERRDERKDRFVEVIRKAMQTSLGHDEEEVLKSLAKHGVGKALAKEAYEIARRNGRFTIFALVDAITRIGGKCANAGDRIEVDAVAGPLLAAVA